MRLPQTLVAAALVIPGPGLFALVPNAPNALAAEAVHVVTKGQTIDQVAKKYGVSVKQLVAANKLKDPTSLKPGIKLVVPANSSANAASASKSPIYASAPKHKGRVKFVRFATSESLELQVVTKKGKLVPGVLPRMARVMRFGKLNIEHPIDAKLAVNIAQVSDHFGGRPIEIISGFRPKTPTQYTPHSNHNIGKAIDMRIPGVPNEVLRDYCRTFKNSGVGYYPNSLFVHFDTRPKSTFWVDMSKPGEAPKYLGGSTDVDHGTDDVEVGPDVMKSDEATSDEVPPVGSSSSGAPSVRPPSSPSAASSSR
ncbi:MAG: hypothetical protein NVS3B20_04590 [Polyangiales bacterium]